MIIVKTIEIILGGMMIFIGYDRLDRACDNDSFVIMIVGFFNITAGAIVILLAFK